MVAPEVFTSGATCFNIDGGMTMLKFVLKRFGYMLVTLWIVITITFMLMHAMPGDPLSVLARKLPAQTRENYMIKYGLNKSVPEQYVIYLKNIVTKANFGESLQYPGRTVLDTIKNYAPTSARIGIQAIFIGFTIGVILGITAAFKRNSWADYTVMFFALLGVSIPSFVFASLLQYFLTVKFPLLPTTGWAKGAAQFRYTILPSIAMSMGSIALYARYMRANCLDVIGQDYILTAKAKGVSKLALVWKHIIRNAILPAITLLGPQIGNIFIGSFVIEGIYSIPGLGNYYVQSIQGNDYSMIMGLTIMIASVFIIALVAVDIVYSLVDPRIRVSGGKR
jgi:oligopeptide transport system permease protein